MFHSDKDSHYTSRSFRQTFWQCQIKLSMSRRGSCQDNAPMEYFFRSIKAECGPMYGYHSFIQAQHRIVKYLIGYYSQLRPYQHNGGMSPNKAENHYWNNYNLVASFYHLHTGIKFFNANYRGRNPLSKNGTQFVRLYGYPSGQRSAANRTVQSLPLSHHKQQPRAHKRITFKHTRFTGTC